MLDTPCPPGPATAPPVSSFAFNEKLGQFAFLSICLVVWVHSPSLVLSDRPHLSGAAWDGIRFLRAIVSGGFARIGLPFFFAVSGYRFFHRVAGQSVADWYWPKLRRRLRSLGTPYLFWIVTFLLAVECARSFGFLRLFLTRTTHYDVTFWLQRIFLHPVPVPLWYLRELLIYAALAPLLYFAVRSGGKPWLALLALWWCLDPWPDRFVLCSRGVFFFSVGAYASLSGVRVEPASLRRWGPALSVLWVGLVVLKTWLGRAPGIPSGFLHVASVMVGLLAAWACYDRAPDALKAALGRLSRYTFFVFAAHMAFVGAASRLFWRFVGRPSPAADLSWYLLCPFAVLAATLGTGYVVRRFLPKVYALSTGWR